MTYKKFREQIGRALIRLAHINSGVSKLARPIFILHFSLCVWHSFSYLRVLQVKEKLRSLTQVPCTSMWLSERIILWAKRAGQRQTQS